LLELRPRAVRPQAADRERLFLLASRVGGIVVRGEAVLLDLLPERVGGNLQKARGPEDAPVALGEALRDELALVTLLRLFNAGHGDGAGRSVRRPGGRLRLGLFSDGPG